MAIAGVAAIAVLLFALPLAVVLKRNYRDEELLKLERDAVAATRVIDTRGRAGDPVELPSGEDRLTVYDSAGQLITGTGPETASSLVETALRSGRILTATGSDQLTAAVPLLENEQVSGVLLVTRDGSAVNRREREILLTLAALALVIVTLAVVAAILTAKRLARPLERLAAAADHEDRRALSDGIPPSGIPEIDAVSVALSDWAGRLDQTLARERAFSADASHQLRTPLAALRLELESVQLERDPPEQVSSALDQVDRLQGTIDTLLAVARDVPRDASKTDLVELARRVTDSWHRRLVTEGRSARVRTADENAMAAVDSDVVEQILGVLIENAYLHGDGAVTVTVREIGGWRAVDVTDEGAGFRGDPDAAFNRRAGSATGHGIGMSLARSLAEAEGGSLRVSESGQNPVLTLLLPPG